jgi:putative flippase GtrA
MQETLKTLAGQASRFTVVGLAATALHIAVAETLLHTVVANPFAANFIAFLSAVSLSFLGHYHWSFKSDAHKGRAFAKFFTVALAAMAANNLLLKILLMLQVLPPALCIVLAAMAVPVISFIFSRLWAFAPERGDKVTAREWTILLCYVLTAVALLLPLFAVDHPQSIDLANHLARLFIRHEQPQSAVLSSFYEFRPLLFPYLAVETLARGLLGVFDIYQTGRIILGIAALLWLAAPALLYRALWKEWGFWPLLSALVVYNANTTWGFVDYTITSALAMIALAGWVASENMKPFLRLAVFTPIGFIIYCCHLQGFVVFGLLLGGYELGKMWQDKKLSVRDFIARGLLLMPLFLPAALHFVYLSVTLPPVQMLHTTPVTWTDRALMLASPFMYGLHTEGVKTLHDISLTSAFLIAGAYLLLFHKNNFSFDKRMTVALALLAVLALVVPPRVLGISFTHYRLPFVAVALLLAATRPRGAGGMPYKILALAFVAVLVVRLCDMTDVWKRYDAGVKEFIAAAQVMKPGNKVIVANREFPSGFVEHYHSASLLTVERQAFIPNLFTVMQFFKAKGDYARLSHPTATHPLDAKMLELARKGKDKRLAEPQNAYFRTWWKDFDYVVAYEGKDAKPLLPKLLKPVAHGSFFTLYKVKR